MVSASSLGKQAKTTMDFEQEPTMNDLGQKAVKGFVILWIKYLRQMAK